MLREKLKNFNIILASGSPRRHSFFKELDLDFTIQVKEVEETYSSTLKHSEITDYLSQLKASVFSELQINDILITSDTIVWLNGKALGKPKDFEEAKKMLLEFKRTNARGNHFGLLYFKGISKNCERCYKSLVQTPFRRRN